MEKERTTAKNPLLQFVTFGIGEEEFAVDISIVQEINKMMRVTRIPKAPDLVEGIVNLRGRVIPTINLRKRFGLDGHEHDKETSIIVIDIPGRSFGFLVDAVNEVLRIPDSVIEPPPKLGAGSHSEYITGIAKLENRLLFLLDATKVTSFEDEMIEA